MAEEFKYDEEQIRGVIREGEELTYKRRRKKDETEEEHRLL